MRLDVAYPGCWLRDDVYALHGHYSDRHATVPMFERLGAGAMARLAGEGPGGPQSAEDYEAILGPMYAWLDAIAQTGGPRLGAGSATGARRRRLRPGGRSRVAIAAAACAAGCWQPRFRRSWRRSTAPGWGR